MLRRQSPEPLSSVVANARQEASRPAPSRSSRRCLQQGLRGTCRSCSLNSQATHLFHDRCDVRRVDEAAQFALEAGTRAVEPRLQERHRELNVGRCRPSTVRRDCGRELQSLRTQAHHLERHICRRTKRKLYRGLSFRALRCARLWHVACGEELHCSFRFDRLNQLLLQTAYRSRRFHQLCPISTRVRLRLRQRRNHQEKRSPQASCHGGCRYGAVRHVGGTDSLDEVSQ